MKKIISATGINQLLNIIRNNLGRRLIKGGFWVGAGIVGAYMAGLLVSALLTRLLTPAEFGIYFIANSFIATLGLVAQMGLGRVVVYLIGEAKAEDNWPKIKGTAVQALIVGGAASIITMLVYWLAGRQISVLLGAPELQTITLMIGLLILPFAMGSLLSEIFRGLQIFSVAQLFDEGGGVKGSILGLTLAILLIYLKKGASLSLVMWLIIFTEYLGLVITVLILFGIFRRVKGRIEKPPVASLISDSWPVLASNVAQNLLNQSPLWILSFFRPEEEVGIWGSIIKLVSVVQLPTIVYRQMLAPFIAELYKQNRKKNIEQMCRLTADLAFAFGLVITGITLFRGSEVLTLVFGNFYGQGYLALLILVLAQLFAIATGPNGPILLMTGHQKAFMYITISTGVISIIASIPLVWKFGYLGAAVGVFISVVMTNLLVSYVGVHLTGLRHWIGLVKLNDSEIDPSK